MNFMPWTASVEYLLRAGLENITRYDGQLVGQLVDGVDRDRFELLSPPSGPQCSTLVVLRPLQGQDAAKWQIQLAKQGMDIAVREGHLRISPHLHNTSADIVALLAALSQ